MGRIAIFAAGVCLGIEQRTLLPPAVLLSLLALVVALFVTRRSVFVQCFCYFLLGFIWLSAHGHWRLAERFPAEYHRTELICEGRLIDPTEIKPTRWRFDLQLKQCYVGKQWQPLSHKVRVSWYRPLVLLPPQGGELWQLSLKFKLPRGGINPHGFDYETWLFQQHISATAYVAGKHSPKRLDVAPWWSLAAGRERLRVQLQRVLPAVEHASVIPAIVLADRSGIDPDMWDRFRDAGTGHLLAISGLHVGLVAAFGALFGRLLWRLLGVGRGGRAIWMGVSSLLSAFVYAGLAGFALPTLRALVMLALAIWALLTGRRRKLIDTLAIAFLGFLIVDPLAVLSAGFWLSFCSVAGIVMGLSARPHWTRWQQLLWVNAAMGLVLTPLSHLLFSQLNWWSSPANLVVVPLFSFLVVPLSLLGTLLSVLAIPGAPTLLSWAVTVVEVCDRWQAWLLSQPTPNLPLVGLAPMGLLILSAALLVPRMWRGSSALLLAASVLLLSPRSVDLPHQGFVVTTLDVGHGLAVLVETQNHLLVYDTGTGFSGERVVGPALRGQGWSRPDRLIISHEDNDHAGGLPALERTFGEFEIMRVADGSCAAGQSWRWDGVDFKVHHPVDRLPGDNNNSCVLRISSSVGSALLAGDVEKLAEKQMLHRQVELDSDLLLVPHHGSKTSSTLEWLKAVSPDVAIVSVAKDSRWGMPHQPVLEGLSHVGAHVMSTGESGAIVARFERAGGELQIVELREQQRRFWHLP